MPVPQTPMSSIQHVRAWLSTLHVGSTVDVNTALFDATLVNRIFELLPGNPTVSLHVQRVDAEAGVLGGTAAVLGEAGSTAAFEFSQHDGRLLCDLRVDLPAAVRWGPLDDWDIAFGGLGLELSPGADIDVVSLHFTATIYAGQDDTVAIPVKFWVPSFHGDWLLAGTFESIGSLTADGLRALGGNHDLADVLPGDLIDIEKFELASFEVAFNPVAQTCHSIRFLIRYAGHWTFFDDRFTVDSIDLDVTIREPFSGSASFAVLLYAQMRFPRHPPFDVGGTFPHKTVFIQLDPDSDLPVGEVFEFFHIPLPDGFDGETVISSLGFTFFTAENAFDFHLTITNPMPVVTGFVLDRFFFTIAAGYDPVTKAISASGALGTQFSIGTSTLRLLGSYAPGRGLQLAGEAEHIPMGALLDQLASDMAVSVPAPVRDLELSVLALALDTEVNTFDFTCTCTTDLAGVTDVQLTPRLGLRYHDDTDAFSATFDGELVLEVPRQGRSDPRTLAFHVQFEEDLGARSIAASYSDAAGLHFADVAAAFGFEPPSLPPSLELGLTDIEITYDFDTEDLALGAASTNGRAAFTSSTVQRSREYFFLLGLGEELSLSNLPLVGEDRPKLDSLGIGPFRVVVSSVPTPDHETIARINSLIDALGPDRPKLPEAGIDGDLLLVADLRIGDESLPLRLDLGGGSAARTQPPPADDGSAANGAGTSSITLRSDASAPAGGAAPRSSAPVPSEGGLHWVAVQRHVGPLHFDRIGAALDGGQLRLALDAAVEVAGLRLSLDGLGVTTPLTAFSPTFHLDGIGLDYTNGAIGVGGAFHRGADGNDYGGAATISTPKLTLVAIGDFVTGAAPSLVVSAVLDAPIGGPSFFYVTGLSAAFGHNRALTMPDVTAVKDFPLVAQAVQGAGHDGGDLLADLRAATPHVTGEHFLGVGVSFTSFKQIDSFAMLVVQFGARTEIDLLGFSHLVVPSTDDGPATPPIADVQLGLRGRFVPDEGELAIEARLTPSSYVLSSDCHLQGGFAFCSWFHGEHEGDFVLSVGGYHPSFHPPPHYPTVPRVGFRWTVDPHLTITGSGYFALTPGLVMAGGHLSATYHNGALAASFDLSVDFLLAWKPMHYDVDVRVQLGGSYTFELLGTHTISIHVAAALRIHGPEFAGRAEVDVGPARVVVAFGAASPTAPTIGWTEFTTSYLPERISGVAIEQGLRADPAASVVDPVALRLATSSAIPCTSIRLGVDGVEQSLPTASEARFKIAPCGIDSQTAEHHVQVARDGVELRAEEIARWFAVSAVHKNVPAALWGTPSGGRPTTDGDATRRVVGGVVIEPHAPTRHGDGGPAVVPALTAVAARDPAVHDPPRAVDHDALSSEHLQPTPAVTAARNAALTALGLDPGFVRVAGLAEAGIRMAEVVS